MNVLIKPVFFLMNQLSYRGKFMMISSVFAIPLAIFAAQLAYTFHQEADQAERSRAGLVYLTAASHLIRDLETIRDSVVVASWQSSTFLNEDLGEIKKRAYRRVLNLIKALPSDEYGKYLFII